MYGLALLSSHCEYPKTNVLHLCIVSLIQMVAKGKDVSHLFPSVVKNVVSKNQEVCVCVCACV